MEKGKFTKEIKNNDQNIPNNSEIAQKMPNPILSATLVFSGRLALLPLHCHRPSLVSRMNEAPVWSELALSATCTTRTRRFPRCGGEGGGGGRERERERERENEKDERSETAKASRRTRKKKKIADPHQHNQLVLVRQGALDLGVRRRRRAEAGLRHGRDTR